MKSNRKRIVSVSLVLLLTLSGLIAIAPTSFAEPGGDVSKIKIEGISWDKTNQEFVVALSLKFGLATAGEHADFLVGTTLNFDVDGISVTLNGESAIVKSEGATKDSDNMITIDPTNIPWDRNDGKFKGLVNVDVTVVIEKLFSDDAGYGYSQRVSPFSQWLEGEVGIVEPGCTIDAECDDGNICNGEETCNGGECEAGTPLLCDDGNECTVGNCDPSTGCDYSSPCSPPPPPPTD